MNLDEAVNKTAAKVAVELPEKAKVMIGTAEKMETNMISSKYLTIKL
jgi:hypothetical protein